MATQDNLLEAIEIQTGENTVATIVVLHGLGADGNDFVPVAEQLDLETIGPIRFIFPHAPTRAVTINNGYVMRAWYDIVHTDLGRREDESGLRESQKAIEALIARENARGIASSRIILAGFSQGCAMTFMTGLRLDQRLAGLVALSGYLPLASLTVAERHSANSDVPVFMAHGRMDPIIPIARAIASRDALMALGHDVEWHEYPMGHSVCEPEIADLNRWLLKALAAAPKA
jgi:phospholipase/carboxylesterase